MFQEEKFLLLLTIKLCLISSIKIVFERKIENKVVIFFTVISQIMFKHVENFERVKNERV